jgi:hypothetical protein
MKKYLMIGLAALAFASCAKHDFETMTQEQIVKAEYDAKFVAQFGQPASNHTWGFGSSTRAFTRSAYPNANQWASQGYSVPDPLTPGQKARVQYYFQMNQYPGGTKDYGQIDFFVQQVYDGGDDPMPGKSPEQYLAANGSSYITSGEHMDHLTAGSDNEHIYNFNNGTCSTNPNVGDNGAALDTDQHSDEIMLMLNTKTDKFGYANSDASFVRTDRYRQVAGSVIDAYCNNNSAFQTWLSERNITDDEVVDDWNRSFIGFDFDMIPDDYVFAGEKTWENGKITSITYSYFSIWLGDNTLVWNGTAYVEASTLGEVVQEEYGKRFYPYMPGTTQKVKMLNAESNQYCGTKQSDWSDDKWEIEYRYVDDRGVEQYGGKRVRVDYMITALRDGYLPDSSSNKKWYKLGNCADGYYSDWIVSFMPATQGTVEEVEYEGRIMAEDLTVATNSDWDFNDVVFDWTIKDGKAYINLLAAGGTLPIRVGGHRNDNTSEPAGSIEIHSAAALGGYMVNTGVNTGKTSAAFVLDDHEYADHDGNGILITVQKGGDWVEIAAEQGEPAGKFNAPINTKWCEEYANIKKVYNSFAEWVANSEVEWAVNPTGKYVDYRDVNENRLEATAE